MNTPKVKVLFVCMGNICRSPAGENVFRKLVKEQELSHLIQMDSAGTYGYHIGNSPDQRMSSTLISRGVPITGTARQFQKTDFKDFDYILTMDEENYNDVVALTSTDQDRTRVHRFTQYCETHSEREVPDPYYGGHNGFDLVADMMFDGCQQLLNFIKQSRL